ncbi:MAG: type II toxin-antitoxin system ParD family antitoxin [Desulfovibrionaceae bacterium]
MHISLTPELEAQVKRKVESGLYNNASEVIREALRFMQTHEQLVYQMKLDALRKELSAGAAQAEAGEFVSHDVEDILHEARQRRRG